MIAVILRAKMIAIRIRNIRTEMIRSSIIILTIEMIQIRNKSGHMAKSQNQKGILETDLQMKMKNIIKRKQKKVNVPDRGQNIAGNLLYRFLLK